MSVCVFVAGVLVCVLLLGGAWCGVVACCWRGFCVVGVVSCGVSLVWRLVVVLLVCCGMVVSVSPAALLLGALLPPSPVLASLPMPLLPASCPVPVLLRHAAFVLPQGGSEWKCSFLLCDP